MLGFLLALTVPVTAIALLYARREYRRFDQLTLLGVFLICAMIFVPNLILQYVEYCRRTPRNSGWGGLQL